MDLFILPLCYNKLDPESHDVAHHDFGKHHRQAIAEAGPERTIEAGRLVVLETDVVHTHQQCGNQGNDHETHNAFRVDGIVHTHADARRFVGHYRKGLESVEHTAKSVELPAGLEMRTDVIKKLLYHCRLWFQAFSLRSKSSPSRTMRCNSSFEEHTNSAGAKSSGATS